MPSPKQIRFVAEYARSRNGTEAAIKAGYSPKTARIQSAQLLAKVNIRQAVRAEAKAIGDQARATAARTISEIALIAFSDIGDVMDFTGDTVVERRASDISAKARKTIQSVKITTRTVVRLEETETTRVVEYKLWSKTDALEKLAKHHGLYMEKEDVEKLRDQLTAILAKIDQGRVEKNDEPPAIPGDSGAHDGPK